MKVKDLIAALATRMRDIDEDTGVFPEADHYSLLWDAIMDECEALCPGVLPRLLTDGRTVVPLTPGEIEEVG